MVSVTPELNFNDEDYAPSQRRDVMTVSSSRCCATVLQQPQPLSVQLVEIKSNTYPPPKATSQVREPMLTEKGTAEPTVTINFTLADTVGDNSGRLQELLAIPMQPAPTAPENNIEHVLI